MLLVLEERHVATIRAALALYGRMAELVRDGVVRAPEHQPQDVADLRAVHDRLKSAEELPKYVATNTYIYSVIGNNSAFELRDPAGNSIAFTRKQSDASAIATLLNFKRIEEKLAVSTALPSPTAHAQVPSPASSTGIRTDSKHYGRIKGPGPEFTIHTMAGQELGTVSDYVVATRICRALDQLEAGPKPPDAFEVGKWLHANKERVAVVNEENVVALERCVYAQQDDNLVLVTKKLEDDSKPTTPAAS